MRQVDYCEVVIGAQKKLTQEYCHSPRKLPMCSVEGPIRYDVQRKTSFTGFAVKRGSSPNR